MRLAEKTLRAIDAALEDAQDAEQRRGHLGASLLGRACSRQLWYGFRWALRPRFTGRLLRLFDRGHREEERFVGWLEQAGMTVVAADPESDRQYGFTGYKGHVGGSLDLFIQGCPDTEDEWILGECKTHNKRSFNDLAAKGVKESKPEHYAQMQIYMHAFGLQTALYAAVCKDDDALHLELVSYEPHVAEFYLHKGAKIVDAQQPPVRINESPAWYQCKWCDYQKICHHGAPMDVNCRTCRHSEPVDGGQWRCHRHDKLLTLEEQQQGCERYQTIHG